MYRILDGLKILLLVILVWFVFKPTVKSNLIVTHKTNYRPPIVLNDYNLSPKYEVKEPQIVLTKAEINCAAVNLYHEARGEPEIGQAAVMKVVLNRVKASNYKSNVCNIVNKYKQFSWTLDKPKKLADRKIEKFRTLVVNTVQDDSMIPDRFKNATNYYNPYLVKPYWASHMKYLGQLGNHAFLWDPAAGI